MTTHLLTSTLVSLGLVVSSGSGLGSGVGVSASSATVTVHVTASSPTWAVMTAVPLARAVTSPVEVTLTRAGSLLAQDTVSSVPLTFSVSLSPTVRARTVRFREMVGVVTVSSGLSMVLPGLGCMSSTGGLSPVKICLI